MSTAERNSLVQLYLHTGYAQSTKINTYRSR